MTSVGGRRRVAWQWVAARSLKQWVMGAAGVVVLASGLFGGLQRADTDAAAVPRLKRDVTVAASPIRLKITDVFAVKRFDTIWHNPRGRYLVVRATIRAATDESLYEGDVADTVRLAGVDGVHRGFDAPGFSRDARPRVFVAKDHTSLTPAVPGLTYDVLFAWEQSARQPVPDEVTVVARALTHRKSTLDDQMLWTDAKPIARGRFAVATRKDAR